MDTGMIVDKATEIRDGLHATLNERVLANLVIELAEKLESVKSEVINFEFRSVE